jgi:signal transduction histidine kinase
VADAKGVRLRIERDVSDVIYVRADSDRLSQVLANLLSNVMKFSSMAR